MIHGKGTGGLFDEEGFCRLFQIVDEEEITEKVSTFENRQDTRKRQVIKFFY